METERIHNLSEQDHSVQRTCFMHNDNSFSLSASSEPDPEELFYKFSSSKAMLVGECSKRPLVINREMSVPPKKRKQLHEESDVSDVSIDQNLQKSENNEKVNTTFCPKLGKENLWGSTPSTSEKGHDEGCHKIEFNLQSSIYVKADDSAEWINLKCFDSIPVDGSSNATFFAGGPIQSSAFCIMPHATKVNQYVAVAVSSIIPNNHSYNDTKNVSGMIEFWNVGPLHERKTLNQSPSMELALYHCNGIITQMKWCPADCYDMHPATSNLPRLGLLAVSSSNSYVYIYRVPQPDFIPKSKPSLPIYFTPPYIKLIPLFGGPSNATRKTVATCIEWKENGERIAAGYGNGAVCLWMLKASHITVKNTEQPYTLHPYLYFHASGASIISLSFAPFNNHRWLVVSTIDKYLRFFDLHDTSAPFHEVKQGFENTSIWSDTFCGVYSSPALNGVGRISLSAKDCCAENTDKGNQKGLFDSSTYVAVSEKNNFHAIADMSGAVTVNFLKNISKPLETSYLTCVIFETEITALDSVGLELETSDYKISITGSNSSNDITSDTIGSFFTEILQVSSSSSSGFCSPKLGKTIVIETTQCFHDDAVNLPNSPSGSSSMNDFKDMNNNRIKNSSKSLNSDGETVDEMIKCSELSEDLMRHLLMMKISNQSKLSAQICPFNTSNNSAYCDSKGAKSDGAFMTSPVASDYTGDTIVYPFEPCFCDTSHPNALSESFGLNEENALHETTVYKTNEEPSLNSKLCTENKLNFSTGDVKSGNSCPCEYSSSENRCEPNAENSSLNYKKKNLREEIHGLLKKSPKEITKSGDTCFQNLYSESNLISKKNVIKHSSHKSLNNSLSVVLELSNRSQPKLLPDTCSSIASNNFIFCDKDDQQLSDRALIQSAAASDYSGDTIIYWPETDGCNKTDVNYSEIAKPGATFRSLYTSETENTFQDTLLHKMDEDIVICESKTKLLTENCSPFASEKYEHFLTKDSLKCNSGYGTASATESFNSNDADSNFFMKDFLISDFQLLYSEYLCEKSDKRHAKLNESTKKEPPNLQKLSYENLIASFGVIFKNNIDDTTSPLRSQTNNICIEYNPLSVIKTISLNLNEGCQSWLFTGGNSGIGRLVFVPDFVANMEKKHQSRSHKTKQSTKRS